MSDTPEVDAAARPENGVPGSVVVQVDFARRIARSQQEAEKKLAEAEKKLATQEASLGSMRTLQATAEQNLAKQIDHARALQELIGTFVSGGELPAASLAKAELQSLQLFRKQLAAESAKAAELHNAALAAVATKLRVSEESAGRLTQKLEQLTSASRALSTPKIIEAMKSWLEFVDTE